LCITILQKNTSWFVYQDNHLIKLKRAIVSIFVQACRNNLHMNNISFLQAILILIPIAVIIGKTIHFFRCVNRKKFKYWLYFGHSSIVNSSSNQSKKTKQIQNLLSLLLLIIVLIELLIILIAKS
jgi:hypothetical protein